MAIFALQSPAGGFLDEDLEHFNRSFDDWCVHFESYEDAQIVADTLEERQSVEIVEITPLSYPKYFFTQLQGTIHTTRQIGQKIICIVEPAMGAHLRLAICDLPSRTVTLTKTRYKSVISAESAFANFTL